MMKETKDDVQKQYQGVGFIKTRKADSKAMDMAEKMILAAASYNLQLLDVIVDDSSGIDVDRKKIDLLHQWMEKESIDAVVVRSIWDITKDADDLVAFMGKAQQLGVSIFSLECGSNLFCNACEFSC